MATQPTTRLTDPLTELRPNVAVPLAPAIARAREAFEQCVRDILAVTDAALDAEAPWRWRPSDVDDADVRYGLYRVHEILDEGVARVARECAPINDATTPAVPRLATATAARWELRGALAGFGPDAWDADPGNAEWSIRRTMGHVIATQRRYSWYSAWYLTRRGEPDEGRLPADGVMPPDPDEDTEAHGPPTEVLARLGGLVDATGERFADLTDAELRTRALWATMPVTIDHRLTRLGSHFREHTIQVDKTLVMIGRAPTEAQRLARLACQAFGRLEATAFGRPAGDRAAIVEEAAAEAARTAASVKAAASAASTTSA
jgi:DinB family protein